MNNEVKSLPLSKFFDIEKLQQMQDAFSDAFGVASIITEIDGTPITKSAGFCKLCEALVRGTEEGRRRCFKSDSSFGKSAEEVTIKKCLSAGLLDAGIRIDVLGKPAAIWMIGQVLDENYNKEEMLKFADELGIDSEDYSRELDNVLKMPVDKFQKICNYLYISAKMLSELAGLNKEQELEIQKRIEIEKKLIDSERHYRLLFESMQGSYTLHEMIYDKTGKPIDYRFIDANPAFAKVTGLEVENIKGRLVSEILSNTDDYWIEKFNQVIVNGVPQRFSRYSEPLKRYFDVYVFCPTEKHFATISYDITIQKQIEKEKEILDIQLRQQQKMESIGLLAGGVAHEINNPLNGIMNYSQLILDMTDDNPQVEEYLKEIIVESERISSIVKDLLMFSRNDKSFHSYARIEDIVFRTVSLVEKIFKNEQIEISVDCPKDLPLVKCRSQQIQQVLMNLIINSRDSLNEKYEKYDINKKIEIACSAIEKEGKDCLEITVADYGMGLPDDIKDKIFDPFFTTKSREKGTGLGLSVSYGLIKEHNGEILFESVKGEKTKFTVQLPFEYEGSIRENEI